MKHKIDRRKFITKSVAAGSILGGIATSSLNPQSVFGANERPNLALVGCGGRGELLARGFISDQAAISYVCDPNAARMEKMGQLIAELQGRPPRKEKDMRTALDDKSIDAVIVCTPNHWHALQTIWSCQAGKDVYLEKPQSQSIWEGRKMIEAARKYDRIVQIGAQNRSAPYIQSAQEYLNSGKIGDIHLVKVFSLKANSSCRLRGEPFLAAPGIPPKELDWHLWLGGAPYRPYSEGIVTHYGWAAYWDFSAGTMDDGIHQLDIALRLMGEPTPSAVSSSGGKLHFKDDDAEIPDMLVNTYDFDDFVMTMETAGYPAYMRKTSATIRRNDEFPYWTQNATRIEFYGSKELMILGRMGGGWITMTSGGKVVEKMYGRVPDDAHRHNFLECLKSRNKPNGDIEIVNNSMNVAHMSNIAYRVGNKKLYFNSKKERFINSEKANGLLRYPYHDPYNVPEKI